MYKLVDDLRKFCGLDWFLVLPCGCCCCCWLFGVKLEPPGWSILRGGAGEIFEIFGGGLVLIMCVLC